MHESNKCGLYNKGISFSHKKERNLAISGTIDGPWGHYGKENKLEKKNIVHSNLYVESKKSNSEKQTKDWQLPETRVRTLGK